MSDTTKQQLHEGKTTNDQKQEPVPSRDAIAALATFAIGRAIDGLLAAAREAYSSMGPGKSRGNGKIAAAEFALLSTDMVDDRWDYSDRHLAHRLAIAITECERVRATLNNASRGASVLAVDRSRSTPQAVESVEVTPEPPALG